MSRNIENSLRDIVQWTPSAAPRSLPVMESHRTQSRPVGQATQLTEVHAARSMKTTTHPSHEVWNRAHQVESCVVRPFASRDLRTVVWLARAGVLPGYIGVDFGDLGRITSHYQKAPRSEFWVAEVRGAIVGMAAVAEVSCDVGELRWLRVAPPWETGLGRARELVRVAAAFARERGLPKLMMHAPRQLQPRLVSFLHSMSFEYSRNAARRGRDTMEFYLDQRAELSSHPGRGRS
jgi:GNAT superfamily N-acetyltransferase